MAGDIKGITIEFNGDTTKLGKALREINKATAAVDKELKAINKGLKFNPTSVELWQQKQTMLKQRIDETTKRLEALKAAKEKIDSGEVEATAEDYRRLERDIVETESKLKHFKQELIKVGNVKLKALSEQFKKVGDKLTSAGKTLTTKVTAPLAGIGVASLKAGMDFDTAMSQVAATSGKTVDEITELRDFAKEMGSTTSFSATQAAEGLNYMALAGYTAEESMQMLPTVLNLAAAGAMDLGTASDMVTDAQTALGLSMEETTTLVDQMAKTASTTNTSVSQLGEAILTIGPTAKNLAGGTSELNQVLGLLADNGIKGSEAGTHLRNVLLSLNTDKVKDSFHELGVEVFDAEGNMRSLSDIFPELSQALDGLTAEDRTALLQDLFNKTDLASLNALLDTDADRWNEVGEAIDNAGGSAEQMAETQLDNMQGSLTLLKSALEGAGIAISDVLAPVVRALADGLTALVTKFNELSPTAQKIIVVIGAIVAAIGPVLVILGVLASSVGSIISLVGIVGPLIAGLAAPIGIAIAIIGALIAIGILLYKNWDVIKKKASAIWNAIKATITNVWNSIKSTIQRTIANIVSTVTSRFQSLKANVQSTFNNIKNAIINPIQNAWEKVKGYVDKLKNLFPLNIGRIFSNLKIPHFHISGGSPPFGIGGLGTKPSISVDWYAKGSIFRSPQIIGVGEAGPEAVVPLDKFWEKMDKIAEGTGQTFNFYITGDNPKQIAEEVKRILITETNRRRLVWQ